MEKFNEKEYQSLILAALLHDVGKFMQRAGEKLDDEDERLIDICCPHYKGRYTHQHALHSGKFVRQYFRPGWEDAEILTLFHHQPQNCEKRSLAKIVTLADWLSSGERRGKEEEEPLGYPEKEPLISIFTRLELNGKKVREQFFPLLPLEADLRPAFPKAKKEEAISKDPGLEKSYRRLWEKFCGEFNQVNLMTPFESFYPQVLYLFEKYTLFIPAATYKDRPDLSLYYHLKSTAAIASCLYHLGLPEEKLDTILNAMKTPEKSKAPLDEIPCLLMGGDISGIQEFMYSVTSKHALKGLRGRSLYLQLLSETIAKTILNLFELPLSNLIFSGGGHFYLLLPVTHNRDNSKSKLLEFYQKVNQTILTSHRGRLSVLLAWYPLRWQDFTREKFGSAWLKLGTLLAKEKRRKFGSLLNDVSRAEDILGPFEEGGERKSCNICGEELREGEGQCDLCSSFEKLASALSTAKFVEEDKVKETPLLQPAKSYIEVLESLGWKYTFVSRVTRPQNTFVLNSTSFLSGKVQCVGWHFLAKHAPLRGQEVKSLDDLAQEADGIKKWGILRADVDHLGRILAEGLGEDQTISRLSMLSSLLSLFFTTQIETIIKDERYAQNVYIVYSGGDDLFIIGPWSVLPEIAQRIYAEFEGFTSENLTLSGGIYFAPSKKFPVYQAADATGEFLEMAKSAGRNHLTFFDQTIPWRQMDKIKAVKELIVDLLNKNVARSLVSMLYSSWSDKILAGEGRISMFRIWRLLYGLKRFKERYKGTAEELTDLEERIITDYNLSPYLDVAVRWAEYVTRKGER